jgi:hypothetical protein
MPTNAGRSQQSANASAAATALAKPLNGRGMLSGADDSEQRKVAGYGLPCAKCHLYYPADLDTCPTCHHKGRVSAVMPKIPPRSAQAIAADPIPDNAVLEAEREEFLRQFKSQLVEAHANAGAPEAACGLVENHQGSPAHAEVCGRCYERVQERLDLCEAALQIDLKEAAQIVYDAVWADASDPSKTYQNAAGALLTELRKRAGISAAMGAFQPRED